MMASSIMNAITRVSHEIQRREFIPPTFTARDQHITPQGQPVMPHVSNISTYPFHLKLKIIYINFNQSFFLKGAHPPNRHLPPDYRQRGMVSGDPNGPQPPRGMGGNYAPQQELGKYFSRC